MPLPPNKIIIAIDGASSTGKSSIAKRLARRLSYTHVDTGAMYRAVTYGLLQNRIPIDDNSALLAYLDDLKIRLAVGDRELSVFLNDMDITAHIRTPEVSDQVSQVAAISAVRRLLVEQQREMGLLGGIVMDGRDIGTVVFPQAQLKIFLHCNLEYRVERRHQELLSSGIEIEQEEVRHNLVHRDHIDSTRTDSPLKQAEDAILVDNTSRSIEETVEEIYHLAMDKIGTVD